MGASSQATESYRFSPSSPLPFTPCPNFTTVSKSNSLHSAFVFPDSWQGLTLATNTILPGTVPLRCLVDTTHLLQHFSLSLAPTGTCSL